MSSQIRHRWPLEIAGAIVLSCRPERGERLPTRVGPAEDCIGFGIPEVVEQAICDVEIVGEEEGSPAESMRYFHLLWWLEHHATPASNVWIVVDSNDAREAGSRAEESDTRR